MDPGSSSSSSCAGKQAENFRDESQYSPEAYLTLYPLYQQAEAAKAKIERTMSQLPRLAAQADEYLTWEMANVTDAYFDGIRSEDAVEAHKQIEKAIARMEACFNNLGKFMRADRTRRIRSSTEPGTLPPPIITSCNDSSETGESSAMGARQQHQPRSLAVLPGEPENDPAEQGLMHPGERVMVRPPPPILRVTFGGVTILSDPRTGPELEPSLTWKSAVSALKRNPGESKRKKVKDLWRRVRDRLKKEDPSA